ncbi:FtsX-like permease family protein, partial [Skermania piniformis]
MSWRAGFDRVRLCNLRELRAHRGRTATSLLVVAVAAALMVAVLAITGSVTGSAERLTESIAGDAALEVSGITDSGFAAELRAGVAATPGVGSAAAMVRTGVGPEHTLVLGADASMAAVRSDLQSVLGDGLGTLLSTPDAVIAGPGTGKQVGDRWKLGAATVTVTAVAADAGRRIAAGRFVVTTLPVAQQISNRPDRLDAILVTLAPGADRAAVQSALTDTVAGRAVVAEPAYRTAQAGGAITLLRTTTLLSASTALIVAGFLVYIAMSMAISQRRPQLSMLRAIGGTRRRLTRDLLGEAAIGGALAGALGAVAGVAIARSTIGALPPAIIASLEARTEFVLPWYAVPIGVLTAIVAAVAAAAIAARQIATVAPVEALSVSGGAPDRLPGRAIRIGIGSVGAVGAAASVALARADIGRAALLVVPLIFVAALAICFAAMPLIVRGAALIARIFGAPGVFGATSIERAPRRVWAIAMTVLTSVVAVLAVTGPQDDMIDAAEASFDDAADLDLYVGSTPPGVFPAGPILPLDLERQLARLPGVASTVGTQLAYATVDGTRVLLAAGAPGVPNDMYEAADPEIRRRVDRGDGILISRDISHARGLAAGDRVRLPTPTGTRSVEVLAVVPYFSVVSGAIVLGIDELRAWYRQPGSTVIGLHLDPGVDPTEAAAAVRATAPPDSYVYTGRESAEAATGALHQGVALSRAITWIVVGVAALALLNTLLLSVLDRRRELGLLRAMGASRRFVLSAVLAEAAGVGLAGGAL